MTGTIELQMNTGVLYNTHVYEKVICKGSQSVLFVRSVVYDPLLTHVNGMIACKGV